MSDPVTSRKRSRRTAGSIRICKRTPGGQYRPAGLLYPFDDARGREIGIKAARDLVRAHKAAGLEISASQWAIIEYTASGSRRGQIAVQGDTAVLRPRAAAPQVCAAAAPVIAPPSSRSSPTFQSGDLVEIHLDFERGPVNAYGHVDHIGHDGWVTVDVEGWRELGVSRYIDRAPSDVRLVKPADVSRPRVPHTVLRDGSPICTHSSLPDAVECRDKHIAMGDGCEYAVVPASEVRS